MSGIPVYIQDYFFSYSEVFDQEYVQGTSTYQDLEKYCNSDKERLFLLLDALELNQAILKKDIMLTLFTLCSKFENGKMNENPEFIAVLFENDGLSIVDNAFKDSVDKLVEFHQNRKADLSDSNDVLDIEIQLKASLNTLFLLIIHNHKTQTPTILQYFQEKQFEEYLLKVIQLSIELFLVPMKKVITLFYLYLHIQLNQDIIPQTHKDKNLEETIFTEDNMNLIDKGLARLFEKDQSQTEQFYQRNIINSTESPLAQVIVVGLLRTMLTTCATNNKYSPQSKGIDLNREWECSVIHILQYKDEIPLDRADLKKYLDDYNSYLTNKDFPSKGEENEQSAQPQSQKSQNDPSEDPSKSVVSDEDIQIVKIELDRHRLFTANIITNCLLLLAKKFKTNCIWQYSYLIQLITDANGVLVFLKFLTDKFLSEKISIIAKQTPSIVADKGDLIELTGDTVYKILKLMFITCDGFTEKISSYLIDYQAFFILKKIPQQFDKREVSKYCYKLLKLQIPLFDKRMLKSKQSYMKVISDLFCKVYVNYQPTKLSQAQQTYKEATAKIAAHKAIAQEPLKELFLLEGIRDRKAMLRNFCNQEEVRKININFNNYHYWKAEELREGIRKDLKLEDAIHTNEEKEGIQSDAESYSKMYKQMWDEIQLPDNFQSNYQSWLEENVWSYYD